MDRRKFLKGSAVLLPFLGTGCVELEQSVRALEEGGLLTANGQGALDKKTVTDGLKEALRVGSERTVTSTSKVDGYLANALIRIVLPEEFHDAANGLRRVGLGGEVDKFIVAMNRSAERAAGEAKPVFWQAITGMTISDAFGILRGHDTAATDYFRGKTSAPLRTKFMPIVQSKMADVGLYNIYNKLVGTYNSLPFTKKPAVDIDAYVTDNALKGLFTVLAQEEARIRKDPAARTTELLRRVFAS